jgi:NAD(P)-dependent dehydrogenase (short-subunit alcohol dehydrogenase family)
MKWGRIINVTTSFSTMMREGNTPYGQAKAAMESASACWAEDLANTGVTCNVLFPAALPIRR